MAPVRLEPAAPRSRVKHSTTALPDTSYRVITIYTVHSFITLYLGSIGMDHVISESCYKGTILQRNDRKMTISWSFSYHYYVKFHGKIPW